MTYQFIKGLDLSEHFYHDAVKPLLDKHYPDLAYSAALIGTGSEVLGFDTPQSMDHDWGPRLMLFLSDAELDARKSTINQMLRNELPPAIHGIPTNFGSHDDGTGSLIETDGPPINHRVLILPVAGFFRYVLRFDPNRDVQRDIRAKDWVSVPENRLLMLTAGRVFYDGLGALEPLRSKLAYYPHDVWLYLLACQWRRIAQEEHFMGRCGQVSDDLGSSLVAARLVRDIMRLCFLMEKKYAPYIKWFGSAFAQLDCGESLLPMLTGVMQATNWEEREAHLSATYESVAAMHNALDITEPLPAEVTQFHNRPFMIIGGERFVDALQASITDEEVLALPKHLGGFDQFIDSTDAQNQLERFHAVYNCCDEA